MALKACTVVIHDLNETAHTLDVTASTLYDAVAQALAAARGHDWVGDIGRGLATVTVKVRNPEVTHIVKIQDFENWLNRGCKSPAETVLKARLRQMLRMDKLLGELNKLQFRVDSSETFARRPNAFGSNASTLTFTGELSR